MPEPTVYLWRENAEHQRWRPTTLSAEGKDEKFLERLIAERPELLGLESRSTGIYGPFVPFSQLAFVTPQGRNIRPDLVFLTASGHAVIVEVKRYDNPELRERHVIAQVVDYAASFAALKPEELLRLFQPSAGAAASWPTLAELLFPEEADPQELAQTLLHRFRNGEIHLVIACDREPTGLRELVEGVASQSALSFGFSVVEVRPYVSDDKKNGILFFQSTAVETEIVARTAVTVTIERGAPEPGVTVTVDSPKKVEQAVEKARRRGGGGRRVTLVDESRPFLLASVADLIRTRRVGIPERGWWGFCVNNNVTTDPTGSFKLIVRFMDYGGDHVSAEAKGRILIDFKLPGKKDRERRLDALHRMVERATVPFEQALGTKAAFHASAKGPAWSVPSTAIPEPQTPEALAAWMEKVYRHVAAQLPLRAAKPVSESDLEAILKGDVIADGGDEGVDEGDHDDRDEEEQP
ncbi:MAG: hypothetical protein M0R80_25850 [Proteobacteria bacterium]|jgi:hypothetical protein|nr:hypothetical protein [Pseudomonadota bacterium]